MEFSAIACVDEKGGIGRNGTIPWNSPSDRKIFADITLGKGDPSVEQLSRYNVVVMGRKTYDSLPAKYRPLPGRINIVLTREYSGVQIIGAIVGEQLPLVYVNSLDAAIAYVNANKDICNHMFVCGGQDIYAEAIRHPLCKRVYLNQVPGDYHCDRSFPVELLRAYFTPLTANQPMIFIKQNLAELKYIELLNKLTTEPLKPNRTGVPARFSFAESLRFPLTSPSGARIWPLLTTKHVPSKTLTHELMWILSGRPNIDYLREKGVKIWDANTSKEFLKSQGLPYREGETGPIYGAQWRHWNAPYTGDNEIIGGIDQIAELIANIKRDPFSRRLIVTAWNPEQLHKMCLAPCHGTFQIMCYSDEKNNSTESVDPVPKYFNIHVNMRSADLALGVPFNIASYSLLAHMIGLVCGLTPKEMVLTMIDCHLYENHLNGAMEQVKRSPRGFPTLKFSNRILEKENLSIDDFNADDISVVDYYPHPSIKFEMAI